MSEPDRKRSRILLVLRWLVAGVFGAVCAVAVVAFVVDNSVLLCTAGRGQLVESYRYEVFGVVIAEGDNFDGGTDVQAEFNRCQCLHVGGSLLFAVAIGLLVGGMVFFLWRPIFESRRRDVE